MGSVRELFIKSEKINTTYAFEENVERFLYSLFSATRKHDLFPYAWGYEYLNFERLHHQPFSNLIFIPFFAHWIQNPLVEDVIWNNSLKYS